MDRADLKDDERTRSPGLEQARHVLDCEDVDPTIAQLPGEIFGPVLHVIRYRVDELDRVLADAARAAGADATSSGPVPHPYPVLSLTALPPPSRIA